MTTPTRAGRTPPCAATIASDIRRTQRATLRKLMSFLMAIKGGRVFSPRARSSLAPRSQLDRANSADLPQTSAQPRRLRSEWMAQMQAVYYRDGEGREPVNDFIDALAPEVQEEIDYTIEMLNRLGPSGAPLPFPIQLPGRWSPARAPLPLWPPALRHPLSAIREPLRATARHRETVGQDPRGAHSCRPGALARFQGPDGCASTQASARRRQRCTVGSLITSDKIVPMPRVTTPVGS